MEQAVSELRQIRAARSAPANNTPQYAGPSLSTNPQTTTRACYVVLTAVVAALFLVRDHGFADGFANERGNFVVL